MFFKNPYTCTLIIRNYVTRKSFNLKLEWKLNLIKKIAFHQSNSELGRKRKTSEALAMISLVKDYYIDGQNTQLIFH